MTFTMDYTFGKALDHDKSYLSNKQAQLPGQGTNLDMKSIKPAVTTGIILSNRNKKNLGTSPS